MERGGSTDRPAHITSDAASRYQICNHTQTLKSTDMCSSSAFIFYPSLLWMEVYESEACRTQEFQLLSQLLFLLSYIYIVHASLRCREHIYCVLLSWTYILCMRHCELGYLQYIHRQILSSIWHMLSFREYYSSMESASGKIKATSKIEASECAHSDALPTATSLVRSNCMARSSKDPIRYCLSQVSFCRSPVYPSRVYLSRANVTHTA